MESNPALCQIDLQNEGEIRIEPGTLILIVGPNNGGKSTFLREIQERIAQPVETRWITRLTWDTGSKADWAEYVVRSFQQDPQMPSVFKHRSTGRQVNEAEIIGFPDRQVSNFPDFLVRALDAQSRIGLANPASAPDVLDGRRTHPHHEFFYSENLEKEFSKKVRTAFGYDFRINRTGNQTRGYLGSAPKGARLSHEYELQIQRDMTPVDEFGDGVRSYVGILLHLIGDMRPVTTIDEPEAFLHPPQARSLGIELALAAKNRGRQVFVATHSLDLIKGALSSNKDNIMIIDLDHKRKKQDRLHIVNPEVVREFTESPILLHTGALDALFYEEVVICEADADIMFFKWFLDKYSNDRRRKERFWISGYGKSGIPKIMEDMVHLGRMPKAIFDLDVLLSPEILRSVADLLNIDIAAHETTIRELPSRVRVPSASQALKDIREALEGEGGDAATDEDAKATLQSLRRKIDGVGKSNALKTNGLNAFPRGQFRASVESLLALFCKHGVLILSEGEMENLCPSTGRHGPSWVRSVLKNDPLNAAVTLSLLEQLKNAKIN